MSKMGDLLIEIEELYFAGHSVTAIANVTGMPVKWIAEYLDRFDDSEYNDSMDGDDASALASAGFGTDEDYGGGMDDPF
jgi:hypothetical protein